MIQMIKLLLLTHFREKVLVMAQSKKIKELRENTGMNRKEFCDYFQIPYRTVTEWERDNRHAPEYVVRLLEYYIRMENLVKEKKVEDR